MQFISLENKLERACAASTQSQLSARHFHPHVSRGDEVLFILIFNDIILFVIGINFVQILW